MFHRWFYVAIPCVMLFATGSAQAQVWIMPRSGPQTYTFGGAYGGNGGYGYRSFNQPIINSGFNGGYSGYSGFGFAPAYSASQIVVTPGFGASGPSVAQPRMRTDISPAVGVSPTSRLLRVDDAIQPTQAITPVVGELSAPRMVEAEVAPIPGVVVPGTTVLPATQIHAAPIPSVVVPGCCGQPR